MKKFINIPLKVGVFLALLLLAWQADAATYYKRSNGTAANKEAATGPCTTLANCMNKSVYAGETFLDGDVVVHCHTMIEDGLDEMFLNISRTISISTGVPDKAFVTSDSKYFITSDGKYFVVQ